MTEIAPLILLIEDDQQTRRFLKSSLMHRGWRIIDAENAKSGLAMLNSDHPDLLILDLGLPDMDGITPIEYRLLTILVRHAGLVVTHRQLLQEVWGAEHIHDQHYLRIYMGQLRHKLEVNPARPRYLLTEVGVGYRLSLQEDIMKCMPETH